VVDEQIVVDTGSKDRTVEIAEKLGAKVFRFDWIGDFSAAKNFALDKAKGEWVIFLDCDEYFSDASVAVVKNSLIKANKAGDVNAIICEMINIDEEKKILFVSKNISPRIFRKKHYIRFANKIHEVLCDEKRKKDGESIVCTDESKALKIYHTGYSKKAIAEKKKHERNTDLLVAGVKDNPEDARIYEYLSKQHFDNAEYEKALEYAIAALGSMDDTVETAFYPEIYSSIMAAMGALKKPYHELKNIFDEAVIKYPDYPDYYRLMGVAAYNNRHTEESVKYFEECLYHCSNYNGITVSLALGQIDQLYEELLKAYMLQGNKRKIVEISVALLNFNKYNLEILTGLMNLFLTQEKEKNIISFLNKIYDVSCFKDKIYLIKASEMTYSNELHNYYIKLLSREELKEYNHSRTRGRIEE